MDKKQKLKEYFLNLKDNRYTVNGYSRKYNQLIDEATPSSEIRQDLTIQRFGSGRFKLNGQLTDTIGSYTNLVSYPIDGTNIPFVIGHKYCVLILQPSRYCYVVLSAPYIEGYTSTIFSPTRKQYFFFRVRKNDDNGNLITYTNYEVVFNFVDLTEMYGAGNEPTTVEAFLQDYPEFNNYVDYTEGSVFNTVSPIHFHGKNLFDKSKVTENYILRNDGTLNRIYNNNVFVSDYIPCKPNTTYCFTGGGFIYYDINKNFIGGQGQKSANIFRTFTTTNDSAYIRVDSSSSGSNIEIFQLEEGSTATAYEPYYHRQIPFTSFFGGLGKYHNLPAGYTEVEYIESSGTQYIDTGFKPNQDTKVEFICKDFVFETGNYNAFFLARNESTGPYFGTQMLSTSGFRGLYNTTLISNSDGYPINVNELNNITLDKNSLYLNETLLRSASYENFQVDYTLPLFANNIKNVISQYMKGKCYSCKIWDNGTIVRDFIPCIQNSNNEVGLYDLVSKQFFGNNGTGSFVAGPKVIGDTLVSDSGITHRLGIVDLGSLSWSAISYGFYSNSLVNTIKKVASNDEVANMLTSEFNTTNFNTVYGSPKTAHNIAVTPRGQLAINAETKEELYGQKLIYELATSTFEQLTPVELESGLTVRDGNDIPLTYTEKEL